MEQVLRLTLISAIKRYLNYYGLLLGSLTFSNCFRFEESLFSTSSTRARLLFSQFRSCAFILGAEVDQLAKMVPRAFLACKMDSPRFIYKTDISNLHTIMRHTNKSYQDAIYV